MQPTGAAAPVYPLYAIRRSKFDPAVRNISAVVGVEVWGRKWLSSWMFIVWPIT